MNLAAAASLAGLAALAVAAVALPELIACGGTTSAVEADAAADATLSAAQRTCRCHEACARYSNQGLCYERACDGISSECDSYIACLLEPEAIVSSDCTMSAACASAWPEIADGGCAEYPDTFRGEPPGSRRLPPKCPSECDSGF
jgi:hypothetical protein